MIRHPKVALVFACYIDQDAQVLQAIAKYNRLNKRWTAFIDDQAVSKLSPDYVLTRRWDGVISKEVAPELFQQCLERKIPCIDLADHPTVTPGIPKIRPDNSAIGLSLEDGWEHPFGWLGLEAQGRQDRFDSTEDVWARRTRTGISTSARVCCMPSRVSARSRPDCRVVRRVAWCQPTSHPRLGR